MLSSRPQVVSFVDSNRLRLGIPRLGARCVIMTTISGVWPKCLWLPLSVVVGVLVLWVPASVVSCLLSVRCVLLVMWTKCYGVRWLRLGICVVRATSVLIAVVLGFGLLSRCEGIDRCWPRKL